MAYHDTQCPCGDRKLPDTMLCDQCVNAFAALPDFAVCAEEAYGFDERRAAAIRLLAKARRRKLAAQEAQ